MSKWSFYGFLCIIFSNLFGLCSILIIDTAKIPWLTDMCFVLMGIFLFTAVILLTLSVNSSLIEQFKE